MEKIAGSSTFEPFSSFSRTPIKFCTSSRHSEWCFRGALESRRRLHWSQMDMEIYAQMIRALPFFSVPLSVVENIYSLIPFQLFFVIICSILYSSSSYFFSCPTSPIHLLLRFLCPFLFLLTASCPPPHGSLFIFPQRPGRRRDYNRFGWWNSRIPDAPMEISRNTLRKSMNSSRGRAISALSLWAIIPHAALEIQSKRLATLCPIHTAVYLPFSKCVYRIQIYRR